MAEKHPFNAPVDLPHKETAAAAVVSPAPLVGHWVNSDPATRGLVKMDITAAGAAITVHAFGACTPTPCDWGAVAGLAYAKDVSSSEAIAFSAQYKFAFKQTIVTGAVDRGGISVETFDHFTDGSGRSNYYSKYQFRKA